MRTCTYWEHHSSIWLNLLSLSFDWTCITPDVPNRRFYSMQALCVNLVPPSSRFSSTVAPKKAPSLSLNVKCDQQTHKKWCLQLWHQSQENYPTKSHNNSANVGFLLVRISRSQYVMGSGYGSNISDPNSYYICTIYITYIVPVSSLSILCWL